MPLRVESRALCMWIRCSAAVFYLPALSFTDTTTRIFVSWQQMRKPAGVRLALFPSWLLLRSKTGQHSCLLGVFLWLTWVLHALLIFWLSYSCPSWHSFPCAQSVLSFSISTSPHALNPFMVDCLQVTEIDDHRISGFNPDVPQSRELCWWQPLG